MAVALMLRPLITAVTPAMAQVRADLGMSEAVAGLTVGVPLVCFGVFAFLAPAIMRRLGATGAVTTALAVIAVGALVRPAGSVAALLAGTVGIGVGSAVANVVLPVVIRGRVRPTAVPRAMGYYTVVLTLGAALGSLVTGPLLAQGISWNAVLFGWGLVVAAVGGAWAATQRGSVRAPAMGTAPSTIREVARLARTWQLTAFMGLQSGVFYSCVTWLPTQLQAAGMGVAAASLGLTVFSTVGMVGSLYAARLVGVSHGPVALWVVVAATVGGLLLIVLGGLASWTGLLLVGVGQGVAFALALTYIAHSPHPRHVGATSAVVQGVGYLVAAVGPSGLGALYAATGTWLAVQLALAAVMLMVGWLGTQLMRGVLA